MKTLRLFAFLLPVLLAARLTAQDVVLAGWHEFSGFQVHRFLNSAKSADTNLSEVSGLLYGGNGSRAWGSTDGTYGASEAVGTSAKDGTMSLKTDTVNNSKLFFSVTNEGSSSLRLNRVLFDFASVSPNAPQNLQLYYHTGDLNLSDGTLLAQWSDILNGLGANSDYEDVEVALEQLTDRSLAPGETATFRFNVDTAIRADTAMSMDNVAIMGEVFKELRVVTYNIHGGYGPDSAGTPSENLTAFRENYLNGEEVLCLQEVDLGSVWSTVQTVFADYPYRYQTINETTASFFKKRTSVAILSKYPFVSTHSKLVNTDPSIDKWERHGQHVTIQVGDEIVNIFNYHNTYDPEDGGNSSETAGMVKFRDYVLERLGPDALTTLGRVLALGDFNVGAAVVNTLMPDLVALKTDWVDHVASMSYFTSSGVYPTKADDLSDHDAVWALLDLAAPIASPLTWATPPAESGTTSLTMTAATVTDLNGVLYYFENTSVPDGSHDSGWQSSAVYTDTGLSPATSYSYTIKARDQSQNLNETGASAPAAAYTDDGDSLPNDWELLYFSGLSDTAGGAAEDWDRDGLIDLHEWIAGTDPTDAMSRFNVSRVSLDESILTITWSSVSGKTYKVTRSASLTGDWLPVATGLVADGPSESYDITEANGSQMFYRVEIVE